MHIKTFKFQTSTPFTNLAYIEDQFAARSVFMAIFAISTLLVLPSLVVGGIATRAGRGVTATLP
jgi:hypothetical protein